MRELKRILDDWLTWSLNIPNLEFDEILIFLCLWLCNFILIYLVYLFILKPILFKTKYSNIKFDKGLISGKKHETNTITTYQQIGKTSVPTTTTYHYYYLTVRGKDVSIKVDNKELYDKFNEKDKVSFSYKEKFETFRFSAEENWKKVDNVLEDIKLTI